MSISKLTTRPALPSDVEQLNSFRENFSEGRIDCPFGYRSQGTETVIVEREGEVVGAVMATASVLIDFIRNPSASGPDTYGAVLLGERALTFVAQKNGIVAAYCAIPSHLTSYIDMVKRSGFEEAFPGCVVLRRPLIPEESHRMEDGSSPWDQQEEDSKKPQPEPAKTT